MASSTKRQGDGTRERRASNSKPKMGGAAKKYAAIRPPPPVARVVAKPPTAPKKVAAPPRAPMQSVDDFGPLPPPGGHSLEMTQKLEEKGKTLPPQSPFARMAARARAQFEANQAKAEAAAATAAEVADSIDQNILADMTRVRGGERRPTRTHEQNAAELAEAQQTLPALRLEDEFEEDIAAEEARIEQEPDAAKKAERKRHLPVKRNLTPYRKEQQLGAAMLLGLPGVVCNKCPAMETCPVYQENAECLLTENFRQLPTRDTSNTVVFAEVIADLQGQRGLRAAYIEQLTAGGALDPNVSRQLQIAVDARVRVLEIKQLMAPPVQPQRTSSMSMTVTTTNGGTMPPGGGLVTALIGAAMQGRPTTETHVLPGTNDLTPGKVLDELERDRNAIIVPALRTNAYM